MILYHIYVLSLVGCNPYLVVRGLLHCVGTACRNISRRLSHSMILVDSGYELLLAQRTVVDDAVLVVLQIANHVYESLRIGVHEFGAVGYVAE